MTDRVLGSSPQKIIILGAVSAIAEAAARRWAGQGASLLLAGRHAEKLDDIAADLRLRGAKAESWVGDLSEVDAEESLDEMIARLGGVDVVLLSYGVLGEQKRAETDPLEATRILTTNFLSASQWCLAAANILEKQGHGTLVVIGSVAGDRGRASNYLYGAAKGGLGLLVEGIAHRLANNRASAVLIKPGFVDTPMTASFKKGLLWVKPDSVARVIVKIARSPGRPIIYVPGFWRAIMLVIRLMPSFVFHKMNF